MMIRTLLIITTVLLSLTGYSQENESNWIEVYQDKKVTVSVYNKFKHSKDNGIKAWVKYSYSVPQTSGNTSYVEIKSYLEYNSDYDKSRCFSTTLYNKEGTPVDTYNSEFPKWEYIIPDSLGEVAADFVKAMNE